MVGPPESYSIFVRFRKTRITMRRRIPNLEDALDCARFLREGRSRDPGAIFVVNDVTGAIVDESLRAAALPASAEVLPPPREPAPTSPVEERPASIPGSSAMRELRAQGKQQREHLRALSAQGAAAKALGAAGRAVFAETLAGARLQLARIRATYSWTAAREPER